MKILHRIHAARPIEVAAVVVATLAAGAAIAGVEQAILDAIGPWCDVIAGGFMAVTVLVHWLDKKNHHNRREER